MCNKTQNWTEMWGNKGPVLNGKQRCCFTVRTSTYGCYWVWYGASCAETSQIDSPQCSRHDSARVTARKKHREWISARGFVKDIKAARPLNISDNHDHLMVFNLALTRATDWEMA